MKLIIKNLLYYFCIFLCCILLSAIFKHQLSISSIFFSCLGLFLGNLVLVYFRSKGLVKDNLKGIAKLMYEDVSEEGWDQENLTKRNLDFTIESIQYIDLYTERLMKTEKGTVLLNEALDNMVNRIGAYIGEVIKRTINQDFTWYEFNSVYKNSKSFACVAEATRPYTLLYSKKKDRAILPLSVVEQFLKGDSEYTSLQEYVEKMILVYSQ